jgi:hypothetical protein
MSTEIAVAPISKEVITGHDDQYPVPRLRNPG